MPPHFTTPLSRAPVYRARPLLLLLLLLTMLRWLV